MKQIYSKLYFSNNKVEFKVEFKVKFKVKLSPHLGKESKFTCYIVHNADDDNNNNNNNANANADNHTQRGDR